MHAVQALLEAQRNMDCEAEAVAILAALGPRTERSGRQHEFVPLHSRIINRVRFGATDCWHWCGVRNTGGYGRMTYQGARKSRIVWRG